MKPSPTHRYFPGLNIYRALAVLMMMIAHAARVQTDMPRLVASPSAAGLFDWPFIAMLKIEPIISALFLFIAGFSVVLSKSGNRQSSGLWLARQGRRMLVVYAISVLFYVADQGAQWPDMLVSSGVLAIIAVGIFSSSLALSTAKPWITLITMTLGVLALTAIIEQKRLTIIGVNAGAGGLFPLISLAYLGSLAGLVWLRWQNRGLLLLLSFSTPIALFALLANQPWTTHPASSVIHYPGSQIQSVLFSLQDWLGLYDGNKRVSSVRYWNQSAIFALRVLPLLLLGLILSLQWPKPAANSTKMSTTGFFTQGFFNWMGVQALNLYILHLVLLAIVEVSGWRPYQGWQTICILGVIVALSAWMLRYFSFVPLRFGKEHSVKKQTLQNRVHRG